jgi:Ankyrin repeats (3 copies)
MPKCILSRSSRRGCVRSTALAWNELRHYYSMIKAFNLYSSFLGNVNIHSSRTSRSWPKFRTPFGVPLTPQPIMNKLPIEIIQEIANHLSVLQYRDFRTLSRRCSFIEAIPYLHFAQYEALSEEGEYTHKKCLEIGGTVSPSFKLQLSELTAFQFYFLACNGHISEFSRSLSCFRMNSHGWEVKRNALVFLLTTDRPCEQMLLILMAASSSIFYRIMITYAGITGYGIHWAAIKGYDKLMEQILQSEKCDTKVMSSCGMNALHFASKYGRSKVLERLLEDSRIPPEVKTTTGYSTIYFAISNDHCCCLQKLLNDPRISSSAQKAFGRYILLVSEGISNHSK